MRIFYLLAVIAFGGFAGSCASIAPKQLVNARQVNRQARLGSASEVAPAELQVANLALAKAEQSFQEDPDSYRTLDLAYVAHRKSEVAMATVSIVTEQTVQARAAKDYKETQDKLVTQAEQALHDMQDAWMASEQRDEIAAEKLSAEHATRLAAEKRAAEAQAMLARFAEVKEEPRGLVITMPGSVFFASNRSVLLPQAMAKLNQVAEVLLTTHERSITVEGHTDSQGSEGYNIVLSQRRADAVRNYLVQKDYQADLIKAFGLGERHPVADNGSAQSRASNRRVEIIVNLERRASNP